MRNKGNSVLIYSVFLSLFLIGCTQNRRIINLNSSFNENVIIIFSANRDNVSSNRDTLYHVSNYSNVFLYTGEKIDYANTYFNFIKSSDKKEYFLTYSCNDSLKYSLQHVENGWSEKANHTRCLFNILYFRKCKEKIIVDSAHKTLNNYLDSL